MSDRKLPILGLSGYWPPGTPGWTEENKQNLRLLAVIGQLRVASRVVLLAAFDQTKIYIVPAGQTNAGMLAIYDAGWFFMTPEAGWNITVLDELDIIGNPKVINWTGTAWVDGPSAGTTATLSSEASAWGDSRVAQNWNSAETTILARSWLWQTEARSQRIRVSSSRYNFGVSGDDIGQLLARMTGNVANLSGVTPSQVPPGPAFVLIGTNGVNALTPLTTLMAQLTAVLDWLQARGHMPFVFCDMPRGQGTTPGVNGLLPLLAQPVMYAYAQAIRDLALTRKGIHVLDVWPQAADPGKATAAVRSGILNTDLLHPSPGIAVLAAIKASEALERAGFKKIVHPISSTNLYSAANPRGCLNKNPTFAPTSDDALTAGTASTGITGVVPGGWTATMTGGGITGVGSFEVVTLPDGSKRDAWKLVVSGTAGAASGSAQVRQSGLYDSAKVAVGDLLEGQFEYFVLDGHVNFAAAACNVTTESSTTSMNGGAPTTGTNPDQAKAAMVTVAEYGISRSPLMTWLAGSTALNLECRPYFSLAAATSATIYFLSGGVRKKI